MLCSGRLGSVRPAWRGSQVSVRSVAVLGGGKFGTVLAAIIASNGHRLRLWMRDESVAAAINEQHRNPAYLPELQLPESLHATVSLPEAVADSDALFFAVPSASCREVARDSANFLPEQAVLFSTTKGLEAVPEGGFKRISEILHEELPGARIGVISGPNIATELAQRQIAATTIASADREVHALCQELLFCDYLRVYANTDPHGVELAGALKNIYAIMGGMAAEMRLGHNTISMLITRSLAEMRRFAVASGADPETFLGLAGVGDLIVTCLSPHSRNFQIGQALARGQSLQQAMAATDTAEGVNTLQLVWREAQQRDIYMPMLFGLYQILYEGMKITAVVDGLMRATEQREDVELDGGAKS